MHSAGRCRIHCPDGRRARPLCRSARSEPPVVCFDESPIQLIGELREPIPAKPSQLERYDCEYKRNGTANLIVFLDVHRPWRKVKVTDSRAAVDFAACMRELIDVHSPRPSVSASSLTICPPISSTVEDGASDGAIFGGTGLLSSCSLAMGHAAGKTVSSCPFIDRSCLAGQAPSCCIREKRLATPVLGDLAVAHA